PIGARQYWNKVTSLHTPTPDLDNVMYDKGTPLEEESEYIYQNYTNMKVELETWQRFAESYINQLDEMERNGQIQYAPVGGELPNWHTRISPYKKKTANYIHPEQEYPSTAGYTQQNYGSGLAHKDYIEPEAIPENNSKEEPVYEEKEEAKPKHNFFGWPLKKISNPFSKKDYMEGRTEDEGSFKNYETRK
ncbi:MAG: hypothetical protein JXR97_15570, partial [Planctomycetes bacterium]|nr:hypothetical protein [Planctomycetota bacterium]